jgi:MEMO1 family protein
MTGQRRSRKAVYSGTFYPGDRGELEQMVSGYLDVPVKPERRPVRGLIVPHAGYVYSGEVAGEGYAMLEVSRNELGDDRPLTVFLLGPAHRIAVDGIAVSSADVWETPLGVVRVSEISDTIGHSPYGSVHDDAHAIEHSLEVQLPFLQVALGELPFEIVPMLVTDADFRSVAELLDNHMKEHDLLVVSTDLSHYLPYDEAKERDRETIDSIASLAIGDMKAAGDACGKVPVLSAMALAEKKHWSITEICYMNSGDTAGMSGEVVGYVSMYIGPNGNE